MNDPKINEAINTAAINIKHDYYMNNIKYFSITLAVIIVIIIIILLVVILDLLKMSKKWRIGLGIAVPILALVFGSGIYLELHKSEVRWGDVIENMINNGELKIDNITNKYVLVESEKNK